MKYLCVLIASLFLVLAGTAATSALAASSSTVKPSIHIMSPTNGAVITGSRLTVRVGVSHFKLVAPVLKNPPALKGAQGHIYYVLDNTGSPSLSVSTTHTWSGLTPGVHTVKAYLATSLHVPFPGARAAQITVTLRAAPRPAKPHPVHPAGGSMSPGIGMAPTTGGAALVTQPRKSSKGTGFNVYVLLAGLGALVVGLFFLGRRYAFAATGKNAHALSPMGPATPAVREGEPLLAPLSTPRNDAPTQLPTTMAFDDASRSQAPDAPIPQVPTERNTPSKTEVASAALVSSNPFIPPPSPAQPRAAQPSVSAAEALREASSATPSTDSVPPPVDPRWEAWSQQPAPSSSLVEGTGRKEVGPADITRSRVLEMTRQWSSVVEELVQQLERQESERARMLARLAELENAVKAHDSLRQVLADAGEEPVSREDLQAVQYVTDSLVQDPDHIVVLASVAQHADRLARVVKNYARIQQAFGEGR